MNSLEKKSVVCFGEILWDNLPEGRKPGGAPMNVAYHLHKLGLQSHLISCIGDDQPGRDLMGFLANIGLQTNWIQVDNEHETSQVVATINEENEVTYEILAPVAWDFITLEDKTEDLVKTADAFVYGSLASRNETSRVALLQMLEKAKYKVFDVNLRTPHYHPELVADLLRRADLVKINSAELCMIAGWNSIPCLTELDCVEALFKKFGMSEILITKGSQGARYYNNEIVYEYPAYRINVVDTIGSGDSFLAAFLAMRLTGEPMDIAMDYSAAMGAFITGQSGACPEYSKSDFDRFLWKKKWCVTDVS